MNLCNQLITKIKKYNPNCNEALIRKAYIFAKEAHGNQTRHSGESYFSHPLAVAEILTQYKLDESSIIAALLHDVLEDTDVEFNEIKEDFGLEIANLVDGLTNLDRFESKLPEQKNLQNLQKLAIAMAQDIRVLIIKLADRLHNLRTISFMPSISKRMKKASESLEIYAPLAAKIGLVEIKEEIEDLAFLTLEPLAYRQIKQKLLEIDQVNENLILQIIDQFENLFAKEHCACQITGRKKKPYSIWRKMQKKNAGFHDLRDIMAFRFVVESQTDCYRALGIINGNFPMIPNSFKDYISLPKDNGYQSLHFASMGPLNKKIEIQIRNEEMDKIASYGVAAHWLYKENGTNSQKNTFLNELSQVSFRKKDSKNNSENSWINEMVLLLETAKNSGEELKTSSLNLENNEVFCFTPAGDIYNFPSGATIIDFAYAIHSEIGNHFSSAKVDGIIKPIDHQLENGDQIQIITNKSSKPQQSWLNFATTQKAKSAIKSFIRQEKFDEFKNLGQAILQKFFQSKGIEFKEEMLIKAANLFHKKSSEDLCCKVAEGIISREEVLRAIFPDFVEKNNNKPASFKEAQSINSEFNKKPHIEISGIGAGMAIVFGSCCNPVFGDQIIGTINIGQGVVVHRNCCEQAQALNLKPEKLIYLHWNNENYLKDNSLNSSDKRDITLDPHKNFEEFEHQVTQKNTYQSKILIEIANKSGSLADITNIIATKKINISHIKTISRGHENFVVLIDIQIANLSQLEDLINSIRLSKNTIFAKRAIGWNQLSTNS